MLRSAWHATVQLGLYRRCDYLHGDHVAVRVARHSPAGAIEACIQRLEPHLATVWILRGALQQSASQPVSQSSRQAAGRQAGRQARWQLVHTQYWINYTT
eukprot:4478447-Pyramimonas_sp.AAC.1